MGDTGLGLCLTLFLVAAYLIRWRTHPLRKIPSVGGFSSPGLSYLTALYATFHAKKLVDAGIKKYYGSAFKIPLLDHWMVVVSGPNMVEELKKRPQHELSSLEALLEVVQLNYMITQPFEANPPHSKIIHEKLTSRAVAAHVPEMVEEVQLAAQEYLPSTDTNGWVSVHMLPTVLGVVARLCSRIFVGVPTCRNEAYIYLASTFTTDLMKTGFVLGLIPPFLKPVVSALINPMTRTVRRAMQHLAPVISERREQTKTTGDGWDDGPKDILQYLIEHATSQGTHTDADIIESLFLINLGAIQNTSNTITHALFHLAESPQYLTPLREEIEPLIATEGWTANAFNKMEKLDSFLTECQRYTGVGITSIIRKAVKDIKLSDGTELPRGTLVQVASHSVHLNEDYYENAETFNPFRFATMREKEGIQGSKYQVSTTRTAYIPFGHGLHACPGRHLAAYQMKIVLTYIILNYDLKFDGDGRRPVNFHFAFNVLPALDGRVMFRGRCF